MELLRAARTRVEALVEDRVVQPVHAVVDTISLQVAQVIRKVTTSIRSFVYYLILASIIFWVIMVTSCLVYALFYYLYVPKIAHVKPVYFQFDPTYYAPPTAVVDFTNSLPHRFLHPGQNYDVTLDFYFPESAPNLDLGMFMVHVELLSSHNKTIHTSSRPSLLKYRSDLLRKINTVILSVPYMMGVLEESQILSVPLMEGVKDDQYWIEPITRARITLSRPDIQVYSTEVRIEAQFSGLRYIMYHWFLTSMLVGITSLLFSQYFILTAIYISYKMRKPAEPREHRRPSRRAPGEEREPELPLEQSMARRKSADFKDDVEKLIGRPAGASSSSSEPARQPAKQPERRPVGGSSFSGTSDFFVEGESSSTPDLWTRPLPARRRRVVREEAYEGEAEGYLVGSSDEEDFGVQSLENSEESEGSEGGGGTETGSGPGPSEKREKSVEDDGFRTPSESVEDIASQIPEGKSKAPAEKESELRQRRW